MWYIHKIKYYSAVNRNELLISTTKTLDFILHDSIYMTFQKKDKSTETENKSTFARTGSRWGCESGMTEN